MHSEEYLENYLSNVLKIHGVSGFEKLQQFRCYLQDGGTFKRIDVSEARDPCSRPVRRFLC